MAAPKNNKAADKQKKGRSRAQNSRPSYWHTFKHWVGKLFEHEALTLVAHSLSWIFSHLIYLLSGIAAFITYVVQILEIGSEHPILLYAKTHPIRISLVAITLVFLAPVFRGLFFAARNKLAEARGRSPDINIPSEAEALLQAAGVSGFSPHATKIEKKTDWKSCNAKIRANKAIDLRIMGSTGWNTFGHHQSPLYQLIEQFQGEIKILLMNPDPALPTLIQRAAETNKTPAQYAKEINDSITRLKLLKQQKGRNISLKLYDQIPIWKMLISNDYMWLQHYSKNMNVEDTPVYTFFSDGDGGTSLFHALYSVWIKRWDVDGNKVCDLTQA